FYRCRCARPHRRSRLCAHGRCARCPKGLDEPARPSSSKTRQRRTADLPAERLAIRGVERHADVPRPVGRKTIAMSTVVHKIGLGTVQFGLDYGISNSKGRTSPQESALILDHAAASGIRLLDTAPSYGDSELTIGRLHGGRFRIVTKTVTPGTGRFTVADARSLEQSFQDSLSRIRAERVYGLLVH